MAEDTFTIIAECSPQAILLYDIDHTYIRYANKAFRQLIGPVDNGILPQDAFLAVHEEDREYLKDCYLKLLSGTKFEKIEFRMMAGDDGKWLVMNPHLYSSETGNYIIAYMRDITAEADNLNTMKKYANKKNAIFNMLSHDLRGPLGIARTVTQVLDRKIDDPQTRSMAQTISRILEQSLSMINDLLGREFMETVDAALVKKRVDIAKKLKDYIEECQRSGGLNNKIFQFSSSHDSIYINLDESKFMQVINNLFTNSLKFTNDDGTISLRVEDKDKSVLFTFSDNGIGIPSHLQHTIFDQFTDARRKGLNNEPTSGLGLSIVKTLVDWHNGKIWFESKEGEGTTFFVEIPRT